MLTTYLARALSGPSPLVLDYGWPLPIAWREVLARERARRALDRARLGLWWRRPALGFPLVAGLLAAGALVVLRADRHRGRRRAAHLPAAGGLCALAARRVAARCGRARNAAAARRAALGVALTTRWSSALLVAATRARNRDYTSAERIWRSVLAARPEQPRALLSWRGRCARRDGADEAEALARARAAHLAELRAGRGAARRPRGRARRPRRGGPAPAARDRVRPRKRRDPHQPRRVCSRAAAGSTRPLPNGRRRSRATPSSPTRPTTSPGCRATHPDPRWRDGTSAVALAAARRAHDRGARRRRARHPGGRLRRGGSLRPGARVGRARAGARRSGW